MSQEECTRKTCGRSTAHVDATMANVHVGQRGRTAGGRRTAATNEERGSQVGHATGWTNEQWTGALADEFFSPKYAGEPVTLAVDELSLARLSGLAPEEAKAALAKVVRLHDFWGYRELCKTWRKGPCDLPPPSLPLLGLNVLAASSMTEFRFYEPLRALLDMPGRGIPRGYADTVPAMWEELHWWLDVHHHGNRGVSTVENHEHFSNIGYSLKQALFRASDRTLLYRFFRAIRLDPLADEVVPVEIRRALAIWSRRQGPSADRLHRLATDPSIEPLADSILVSMANNWDGRLRDPRTGSRSLPLRLMLTVPGWALGLAAPLDVESPASLEVQDGDGQAVSLLAGVGYYEPAPLPISVDEAMLADGLELSGEKLSFFLDGDEAVAFQLDDDLAAWVSSPQIIYGERHHILVNAEHRAATEKWLVAEGAEGSLAQLATPKLPQGWFLFSKVRLNARPTIEPPGPIRDLLGSEASGDRLRLVGGLRLAAPPRTYLTGGTPNIVVPEGLRGHKFEIRAVGQKAIPRIATDHEFKLSAFDLQPGDYEIVAPTATLRFTIIDQLKEKPGEDVGSVVLESGEAVVRGLAADGSTNVARPTTVEVPEGGPVITLGDSPSACIQSVPQWLEELDGPLSWDHIDVWCEGDAVPAWQLTRSGSGWRAKALARVEPREPDPRSQWAGLIRMAEIDPEADGETKALWRKYALASEDRA